MTQRPLESPDSSPQAEAAATCPRCGYDQRGVIETWKRSCPVQGTCSECGLSFKWAEVLVSDKFEPRWCVEFAHGWFRTPKACFITLIRSYRPWRFWGRLRMSQKIRPLRLAFYILMLIASLCLLYVPAQASAVSHMRRQVRAGMLQYRASIKPMIASYQQSIQLRLDFAQEQGLSDDDVAVINQMRMQMQTMQAIDSAPPPAFTESALAMALEAVFTPFSRQNMGLVDYGGGLMTSPCVSPVQLWPSVLDEWDFIENDVTRTAYATTCDLILLMMLPAGMALLPASRRKAKVRWAHIGRIAAYSAFIPWTTIVLTALAFAAASASSGRFWLELARNVHWGSWIALPIWWAAAIRRYLRMPHAEGIAAALLVIIFLLMLFAIAPLLPPWLSKMLLG